MYRLLLFIFLLPAACQSLLGVDDSTRFQPLDVFQLEHASDPQISPDGTQVIYVRNFMDIMTDAYPSAGETTSFEVTLPDPVPAEFYYRVRKE